MNLLYLNVTLKLRERMKSIEKKTLFAMHKMYCKHKHNCNELCVSCSELYNYSVMKMENCYFQPEKPACSRCPVHCYKPTEREKVRDVMRYAGPRMIFRHPILAIFHIINVLKSKNIINKFQIAKNKVLI